MSNGTKFVDFNSLEIVGRNWKQKCLSGEYRPYKSFPASPIVGVPECSVLAVDSTDLKFKMRLNISAARYLWKCVVSEASSSLASWLQPRWAVKAPLLAVLNSSRHRPATLSDKSELLNASGLPSPLVGRDYTNSQLYVV